MPAFFDELIAKDFYEKVAKTDKELRFGRVYWTHAYYPHEHLQFWRPSVADLGSTSVTDFKITSGGDDRFDHTPLANPPLRSNEEFIVIRAKRRPVVMLIPPVEILEKRAYGGSPVSRKLALVAQTYSIEDVTTGKLKFEQQFIDNVRRLNYPEVMFLPQRPGFLQADSLLRLDECQSVYTNQLEDREYQLGGEVRDLLRSQFLFKFDGTDDDTFTTYREICTEE